jgi:glucose/arabinose dehydrogenase
LFQNYDDGGGTSGNNYTSYNNSASSIIIRINYDGRPVWNNPFMSFANFMSQAYGYTQIGNYLIKCFAYGIRNSFGMTLDPLTKSLWISDNGPDTYDEVDLVQPGFNGGWAKLSGPISRSNISAADLVNIRGSNYSDPVFSWQRTVAPTGLDFAVNSKAFKKYNNNLFVGDFNNGDLYNFKLNPSHDGFVFRSLKLQDNVADTGDSMKKIIFATGFEEITDVKMGPDGFLYVLTYSGNLFRVIPKST